MDETDYFQKRDKYKEKIVDDEWDALKKIKSNQKTNKRPADKTSGEKPCENKDPSPKRV